MPYWLAQLFPSTVRGNVSDHFNFVILIDTREKTGSAKGFDEKLTKAIRDHPSRLYYPGIVIQVKTCDLSSGDLLFVAESKTNPNRRLVLDMIIERKTYGDLLASLTADQKSSTDKNRYFDQQCRMIASGISKRIYLIEGTAEDRKDAISGKGGRNQKYKQRQYHAGGKSGDQKKDEGTYDKMITSCLSELRLSGVHMLESTGVNDTIMQYANLAYQSIAASSSSAASSSAAAAASSSSSSSSSSSGSSGSPTPSIWHRDIQRFIAKNDTYPKIDFEEFDKKAKRDNYYNDDLPLGNDDVFVIPSPTISQSSLPIR